MKKIAFEWNKTKASTNKRKHHVTFEEAKSVFHDEQALVIHTLTIQLMKTDLLS